MKQKNRPVLFAFLAVLCWSTAPTAFKLGLKEYTPAQLIFIASGTSVIILFFFLLIQGKMKLVMQQNSKQLVSSMLLGAFNPFIYYIILFKAYSLLPAQLAQPINMIWPIILALLSVPMLRQKIGWQSFVALGISFIGVIIISSQGGINGFHKTSLLGVVLAIVSSVIWSLYWILNVKDNRDETLKLFMNFVFGFAFLSIALTFFSGFTFQIGEALFAGIYIGFFEIGITYILWLKAMQLSKNNAVIGNLVFLAPFISLIFIYFILKEEIFITTFIGIIFIVGGILFQQIKKGRKA